MAPTTVQLILTAVSAASALAAVVVTLIRDALRRWLRGPRLTLRGGGSLRAERAEAGPVEDANAPTWTATNDVVCFDDGVAGDGSTVAPSYRECYLRLRVHAKPGRDAARGVRAFLLHVERPSSSSRQAVPDYFLKWSGPLDAAEDVDIPAGTFRRLDVLRHRWTPATAQRPAELFLTPGLRREQNVGNGPAPSARNRLDQAGEYSLIIVLSAENARPTTWKFAFSHGGRGPIEETEQLAACIRRPVVEELKGGWDLTPPSAKASLDELTDAHRASD